MSPVRWPYPCVLLLLFLGGCITWRPFDAALSDGQRLPSALRATRPDSSRVTIIRPFIQGDTLYGSLVRSDSVYGRAPGSSVGLPMAEVAHLERQSVSTERTLGALILLPAAVLGVTWVVGCGGNNCDPVY